MYQMRKLKSKGAIIVTVTIYNNYRLQNIAVVHITSGGAYTHLKQWQIQQG